MKIVTEIISAASSSAAAASQTKLFKALRLTDLSEPSAQKRIVQDKLLFIKIK